MPEYLIKSLPSESSKTLEKRSLADAQNAQKSLSKE